MGEKLEIIFLGQPDDERTPMPKWVFGHLYSTFEKANMPKVLVQETMDLGYATTVGMEKCYNH